MVQQSTFSDTIRFLRKGSTLKIWHALSLLFSYFLSRLTRKPYHFGLPVSMAVEPTTACNLRCPECPSGLRSFSRPTGNIKLPFYKTLIDQTHRHLWYLTLYFQGEPFINGNIFDLIQYAHQKGIYTASSTNGHFLNDENARQIVQSGLDRLIVSIDGTTQEVYEAYRKEGNLEKVLEGTRNLVKWKKKLKSESPFLIFQFLVVKPNEHQIDEVRRLADEIGVNRVVFKTAQVYDYKNGNPFIPNNQKYSRYVQKPDGSYQIKNKLLNHCWKMWHSCVVTWDGSIVPCCFDKDASHKLGNLQKSSFKSIWRGAECRHFRKKLLKSRKEFDICQNCTEGTKIFA
jgi:radical SAM protein with 4Fe4S-binding SPASM domain